MELSACCAALQRHFLLQTKSRVETINTSTGVDQLLLAGVEGVAVGADFDGDAGLGGAGLDNCTACAADGSGLVIRMDAFLHGKYSSSS